MPNHVHLEIKDNKCVLEFIMRSLMVSYVSYFNKKYDRVGHLFQDRFLSKQVETNEYVLDLQRYIHQNPEKAGICTKERYKWSSYREYISKSGITDKEFVMKLFEQDIRNFIKYNEQSKYSAKLLNEFEMNRKLTDEQAKEIIQETLQINNLQEIQRYNKKAREEILSKLVDIERVVYANQMARVIGVSRKIIERLLKQEVSLKGQNVQKRTVPKRTKGGKNGEG